MRTTQALSITLPREMAQMVKDKVASGEYATESVVIRDGLPALQARDAAVERWLLDEVAPVFDLVTAGTEPLVSADEVLGGAARRHRARKAGTTTI